MESTPEGEDGERARVVAMGLPCPSLDLVCAQKLHSLAAVAIPWAKITTGGSRWEESATALPHSFCAAGRGPVDDLGRQWGSEFDEH